METTRDDAGENVGQNFDELRAELGDRVQEIRETVTNYVDAHPLASVGMAFGVGYLLSGALFSRTTFKVARLGGRFALGGFLKQLVAGIGPGLLAAALGERGHEGPQPRSGERRGNGGDRS